MNFWRIESLFCGPVSLFFFFRFSLWKTGSVPAFYSPFFFFPVPTQREGFENRLQRYMPVFRRFSRPRCRTIFFHECFSTPFGAPFSLKVFPEFERRSFLSTFFEELEQFFRPWHVFFVSGPFFLPSLFSFFFFFSSLFTPAF